jgi:hypothetical protein
MLPVTNFLFAGLALLLVIFISTVYIFAGRVHSIAYGRMRFIAEAKEQYKWLIESVKKLEQIGESSRSPRRTVATEERSYQWTRLAAWILLEVLVMVVGAMLVSLFTFGKIFFFTMLIWRNVRFQYPNINLMDQMELAMGDIEDIIGSFMLRALGAIAYVFNSIATIPFDLSAAEVTCDGSVAPIVLLIDVVIFVRVICIVDSDIAAFLETTFSSAHTYFRRALMNPKLDEAFTYPFRTKMAIWLWSFAETSLLSSAVIGTFLQLLLGFVSIGEFFWVHAHTNGCNKLKEAPYYDSVMAVASTVLCYYLIPPVIYTLSKFLIPRLPDKERINAELSEGAVLAKVAQDSMHIVHDRKKAVTAAKTVYAAVDRQAELCGQAIESARALAVTRIACEGCSLPTKSQDGGDSFTSSSAVKAAEEEARKADRNFGEAESLVKVAKGYLSAMEAKQDTAMTKLAHPIVHKAEASLRVAAAKCEESNEKLHEAILAKKPTQRGSTMRSSLISLSKKLVPAYEQMSAELDFLHDEEEIAHDDDDGDIALTDIYPAEFGFEESVRTFHIENDNDSQESEHIEPGGAFFSERLSTAESALLQLQGAEKNFLVAMRKAKIAIREAGELAEAAALATRKVQLQTMSKKGSALFVQELAPPRFNWDCTGDTFHRINEFVQGLLTDSVRPLSPFIQPDDAWLSWRFRWAYKTLRRRTLDEDNDFILPLNAVKRVMLRRPRRLGLVMPFRKVPDDELESEAQFQIDWNVERYNRLPPYGFIPFWSFFAHARVMMNNVGTMINIYFRGVWTDECVKMLALKEFLDDSGVENDPSIFDNGETVLSALKRVLNGQFTTERKVKTGGDGDAYRMLVSSMLYAKLVPRATLCMLFPYGAFVSAFVSNTVAFPIWCSRSPYLDDRLPRLLVFESRVLAEERVALMGNKAHWKVLCISCYIFVTESRLIRFLYGFMQYMVSLSILFFPYKPFLGFSTIVIFLYSIPSMLYLVVVVANMFGIKDDDDTAQPGPESDKQAVPQDDPEADIEASSGEDFSGEASSGEDGARLLSALREMRECW